MTATYTLNPHEWKPFLKLVEQTYTGRSVRITIESFSDSASGEETHERMLRALEAEKQGDFVHTMTVDELEAMTR